MLLDSGMSSTLPCKTLLSSVQSLPIGAPFDQRFTAFTLSRYPVDILDLAATEKLICKLNKLCQTFTVLTGLELLSTVLLENLSPLVVKILAN